MRDLDLCLVLAWISLDFGHPPGGKDLLIDVF